MKTVVPGSLLTQVTLNDQGAELWNSELVLQIGRRPSIHRRTCPRVSWSQVMWDGPAFLPWIQHDSLCFFPVVWGFSCDQSFTNISHFVYSVRVHWASHLPSWLLDCHHITPPSPRLRWWWEMPMGDVAESLHRVESSRNDVYWEDYWFPHL